MALSLSASIYGKDGNGWNLPMGKTMGFPTSQILIQALSPAQTFSGVSCQTVIQLLPSGLNISQGGDPAGKYYTPTATATVISSANS